MTVLSIENVSIIYSDDKRLAVSEVSFKVDEGEYMCLIGSNGSGKSTLIKGVVGLVPVTEGRIDMKLPPEQVAYLSQVTEMDRDFPATVREVVMTGRQRAGRRLPFYTKSDGAACDEALRLLEIEDLQHKRIGSLSGGQRQRALLARALCRDPKLLILDEPCAGLDPEITAQFYGLIDKINKERGVTIIMVSHDLDQVEKYASHIVMLNQSVEFDGNNHQWLHHCKEGGGHYHDTIC